ncbi:MAG: hypothetical protein KW802_02825 [Candidatus Doudnabacteria bacterium]|nr:hypothetical protein [Candidatus Doudnabacteria bacterium]
MQNKKLPETLTWKAQSHIQHQRSPFWYFMFAIVTLALLSFAVYSHSLLTGITFFLVCTVLLTLSIQPSREVTYKITKTGISVGHLTYPYKIIKRFWIIYNPPEVKTINLETTAYLNNRVILQLGNQDPVLVKLILGDYILEDLETEESISETLARRLKI